MPDNKKNTSKTPGAKKSGSSSLWIIALAAFFVVAFFLGLLIASYYPAMGALVFLLLLCAGYFLVPGKARRFYALILASLIIALVILTFTWELVGGDVGDSMDAPTVVAFLAALLGLGLLVGAGIVAITIFLGTSFILPWVISVGGNAGMDKGELRKFIIRTFLGVAPSYVVFSGDQIIAQSPPGIMEQFGGPGLAIIKPETAVVFEHMGSISRISGPGVLKDIKMFELPKTTLDLRPQWDTTGDFEVSTQDGEVVQLSVRYRCVIEQMSLSSEIDGNEESAISTTQLVPTAEPETLTGTSRIQIATIRSIAYGCGPKGWKEETRETVRSAVRSVIQGFVVDELFPALQYSDVRHDDVFAPALELARFQATEVTRTWGLQVDCFAIEHVVPPEAVTEGTRVLRKVRIDALSTAIAGKSEASIYADLQSMEAQSLETKLRIILGQFTSQVGETSPEDISAFVELFGKMASILGQNREIDYGYLKDLRAVSRGSGNEEVGYSVQDVVLDRFSEAQPSFSDAQVGHLQSELLRDQEGTAFVQIEGRSDEDSLYVNNEYVLYAGVFSHHGQMHVDNRVHTTEPLAALEIVYWGEDMSLLTPFHQVLHFVRGKDTGLARFAFTPEHVGTKHISVDFYYLGHWLQSIGFDVQVAEAHPVNAIIRNEISGTTTEELLDTAQPAGQIIKQLLAKTSTPLLTTGGLPLVYRLLFRGMVINNSSTLADIGIHEGDELRLVAESSTLSRIAVQGS